MYKYYFIGIALITHIFKLGVSAADPLSQEDIKAGIIPTGSNSVVTSSETGEGLLDAVLEFIKDGMFSLMMLIAIGMFLFIGGRLLMARGNPEEFKKAMQSFLYAGIGIFVVVAAWALVRFIVGIKIL